MLLVSLVTGFFRGKSKKHLGQQRCFESGTTKRVVSGPAVGKSGAAGPQGGGWVMLGGKLAHAQLGMAVPVRVPGKVLLPRFRLEMVFKEVM